MSQTVAANVADFVFTVGAGDREQFKVAGFSGTEGLSRLFQFRVELVTDEPQVDYAAIVGEPCTLEIAGEAGKRYVHGIVRAFQRVHEGSTLTHYAAEIVPRHWLLTRRFGCRIFQKHNCPDMTIPGIVQKVLKDADIPTDQVRLALSNDYAPREYVVQYRESELDFLSRLMEEEGIHYFFEHTADGHVMVLGDSPVSHAASSGLDAVPFRSPSGLEPVHEHVTNVQDRHEVQFGKVHLNDFNFTKPPLQLDACRSADRFTGLEFSDYPGEYREKPPGERYAQIRLEEYQCARNVVEMTATVRNFLPGCTFGLDEHPSEPLNRRYVVTCLTHRATQPQSGEEELIADRDAGYEVQLRAIPAEIPYRPARVTPRPTVLGSQTAIVVGPESEEIYTDKYGRVKVQFHWDREGCYDENSSCWMRVSQAWAGGKYGAMFLPRVGHEVIVDFLEGDPDRPIITGRVYNGDLMPVYDLPEKKYISVIKSQSTKGGGGCNAIVLQDKKDEEILHFSAEKEFQIAVKDGRYEEIGGERHLKVHKDRFELIKQNKYGEVKLDFHEKVGGNKSLVIGGSVGEQFGGSHAESCGAYHLTAGKGGVVIESCSAITLKVGGNFVKIHGGGVDIMGAIVNINSGGSADNGCGAPIGEVPEPTGIVNASPGYDVRYDCDHPHTCGDDTGGAETPGDDEARKKTSWIEIELVDEAGQAWPHEKYEITTAEGEVISGTLDENGLAHVELEKPGVQQISFPKLDRDAWERV